MIRTSKLLRRLLSYKWFIYKWDLILTFNRLYCRVIWMCIAVVFYCRFCGKWVRKYGFLLFLSNLLILTIVIRVDFGRWRVYEKNLMFLSWNGAKFRILQYKLFLGKRCGVHKNYRLGDYYIRRKLGLCVPFWIIMI